MACGTLTKGRGLDCNRISGGVKKIFFSVYDENVSYTYDATHKLEIDAIDFNSTNIYEYVMPLGVASVTDTIVGSRENGTIHYTPTVNIILNKLTKEDQNEIKLLAATKVRIFAQLNQQLPVTGHDAFIALGMANGLELNAGTMDSGAAFGDRNGYTLTFDGMEPLPFAFLEDYTTAPWDQAGFVNEPTPFIIKS
tara:strand:+ start:1540 stop:2124 length:585 start_codon:yes stop_codon:yes gene_type:complete